MPLGAHERFQADHAAVPQCRNLIEIAGDQSAPKREVSMCGSFGSAPLFRERRGVAGRWMRVERHIEKGRGAARGAGAGAGGDAFPVGAAGLVEMHVGIDDARQHEQACRIEFRRRAALGKRSDFSLRDSDCGVWMRASDEKVKVRHRERLPKRG